MEKNYVFYLCQLYFCNTITLITCDKFLMAGDPWPDPWETDELEPGALSLWAFWQLSLPTPTGELESWIALATTENPLDINWSLR